ncbi:MAG TPA: protein kinase, partial [Phototrophicaceae bacterium]|nr:protein kinase [Phototrophicaceae bacterium]
MIGKKLGPYEIREEVGRGGMATVYRAYQPNVDRDVAVKVIHNNIAGDSQAVQRFQREARLIARLEHPHILPVYDFDGSYDPPYIVMRYLDGGTLKDVMQQGTVPLNEVVYVMQQITAGLDYAHRQGIVHRDVKPNNIMIDRDGNAFVTDLGIARIASSENHGNHLTATGMIMGTPDYMSPEQALGEDDIDYRTDIYALGAMLFHMLTGQLPYASTSTMGMLMMHIQEPTPFALEINSNLPADIDDVIHKAMAKTPGDRYQSMAEMGAAITEALGGMTTTSPLHLRQVAGSTVIRSLDKSPTSRGSQSTPSERNKQVTALYANTAEYTAIVDEAAGGEVSRRALKDFWDACDKIVAERGGSMVSRTDNEALMLWGADAAREDDTERAVFAGIAMQEAMRKLGATYLAGAEDEPLPLNIGINTGLVLLTPATSGSTFTASGATVSLANRLMQAAEGVILVTHDVYRQVRGVFTMETDEPLKVRGSKATINTYRITAVKARAFRLASRGVEGIETQMVGRDAEFKQLQNAFLNAIEDNETQVLTVISDAGVGKSRLMYEFDKWSDLRPEKYRILSGRSTASTT